MAKEGAREGWHLRRPERQDCREEGDFQEAAVAGGSKSRCKGWGEKPHPQIQPDARELLPG